MTSVIASIRPNRNTPQRLVGAVTKDKATGFVHIEYKEPGKVKVSAKTFDPGELIAYSLGAAGFVVAMTTNPIVSLVGELVNKNDTTYLKTADGNIVFNKNADVTVDYTPVDPESREARAAERSSRVKGGGRAVKADAPKEKTGRSSRRSAEAATGKKVKEAAPAVDPTRKKRRRREAA